MVLDEYSNSSGFRGKIVDHRIDGNGYEKFYVHRHYWPINTGDWVDVIDIKPDDIGDSIATSRKRRIVYFPKETPVHGIVPGGLYYVYGPCEFCLKYFANIVEHEAACSRTFLDWAKNSSFAGSYDAAVDEFKKIVHSQIPHDDDDVQDWVDQMIDTQNVNLENVDLDYLLNLR